VLGSLSGAWKLYLFSPARLPWVKVRLLICPDRIFGRGGRIPIGTLGSLEEEWGEEYSVEDMVRTRRKGGRYQRGDRIKRA
jgi:hypothetical protein